MISFDSVIGFIKVEYARLAAEYNINPDTYPIFIADRLDEAIEGYDRAKNDFDDAKEVEDFFCGYHSESNFATTKFYAKFACSMDDTETGIDMWVIVKKAILMNMLYEYDAPVEFWKKYFRLHLRHEIGHILHHLKIFDPGDDYINNPFTKMQDEYYKRLNDFFDSQDIDYWIYQDDATLSEYLRFYYSLPGEIEANNEVGIDVNEIINMELELQNYKREMTTMWRNDF